MIPRLSVIVPTYQRAEVLGRCLDALSRQTCEESLFEVIVSDDGSKDCTREVVTKFAGGPRSIRYLHQPNSGANKARNRAIQSAAGGILLFINDDVIPSAGMIQEHLATHAQFPDDRVAVLGRVTISPDLPSSRLAPLHLDRAFKQLGEKREFDWRAFFTCNVSVKKSLLLRGGLFEESIRYHEDLELSERLSHQGLSVIYNPNALGYHEHFLTEKEFMAIAIREAEALTVWARKSPHLIPLLGTLGFESALPPASRLKHRAAGLIVNTLTVPALTCAARNLPASCEFVSQKIYLQVYQSRKRKALAEASTAPELRFRSAMPDSSGCDGEVSRYRVLGVEVDCLTIKDLNDSIVRAVLSHRRWIIANHNLHSVFLYHRDPEMRRFYALANRIHIDGMGVFFVARLLRLPVKAEHRVTYLDWIDSLLAEATTANWRVFYLGSRPGVAEIAAGKLRERFPGLKIEMANGYFDTRPDSGENLQVIERIRASKANLLIVGMGMPRQERWVAQNQHQLGSLVILMSGGMMDYIGGFAPVPPRWLAKLGLEWLCRLVAEPRRLWRRYLLEPWSLLTLLLRDLADRYLP